jgi:putative ABC transport system permease protein
MLGNLRFSLRQLRKSPAYTTMIVLTLALGIGANTAIFSVVKAVLLNQLPYRDPDRLVKFAESDPDNPLPETIDFTTTNDLRERSHSFESMSLSRDGDVAIVEQGKPELLEGLRVNFDYFDTLGVTMQIGRAFHADEDQPDTRYEAILTHGLWVRRFGGDMSIVGRTVRLNDKPYKVVGVLPESFRPLARVDRLAVPEIYTPLGYDLKQPWTCRGCQHLQIISRLKPGVSAEQARAELNGILREVVREHPKDYDPKTVITLMLLRDYTVGKVRTALWVLLGAVGMVLLIACSNVAHLVLARASSREKEMAVRAAFGAGRLRLMRQMLTESVVLALLGGMAGAALAWWGTTALATLGPKQLPRAYEVRIDIPVLLFTFGVSVLAGLLFGVAPALRASRTDPNESLKESGRSTEGRSRFGYRNILVTVELALAFVLAMGAGLLGKSLIRLLNVDPGYDAHNVLTAGLYVYGDRYHNKPEAELNYYEQAMQRLRATPGIEGVAMASNLPLMTFDRAAFHIQDRPLVNDAEAPSADRYSVSPGYFQVLRIPLKRGRWFSDADRKGTPLVAIISESCARTMFANDDPIGKHIQMGARENNKEWMTIVGVVGDIRQYGLDQPSNMEAYIPQAQDLSFGYNVAARTTGDPRLMEQTLRQAFLGADNTQPVFHVRPLEDYVAASLAARRFTLMLLGLFGTLALVLAAIGIYGVISYAVSLRTRELGIRIALGAPKRDILQMVLGQGVKLAAIGLGLGLVASFMLTRFLASLLFEVKPVDELTTFAVIVTLTAVALVANYLPARRAAQVDPNEALRCE